MAEIVTFLLTAVYAQSALLRVREYYLNKGKILVEQVLLKVSVCPTYCLYTGQQEKVAPHHHKYILHNQLVSHSNIVKNLLQKGSSCVCYYDKSGDPEFRNIL